MVHIIRLLKFGIDELIEASDAGRMERVELSSDDSNNLDRDWDWFNKDLLRATGEDDTSFLHCLRDSGQDQAQ